MRYLFVICPFSAVTCFSVRSLSPVRFHRLLTELNASSPSGVASEADDQLLSVAARSNRAKPRGGRFTSVLAVQPAFDSQMALCSSLRKSCTLLDSEVAASSYLTARCPPPGRRHICRPFQVYGRPNSSFPNRLHRTSIPVRAAIALHLLNWTERRRWKIRLQR